MPGDEYSSVVRGGLKLKGVQDSKVDKHKKKRKKEKRTSKDTKDNQDAPARGDLDQKPRAEGETPSHEEQRDEAAASKKDRASPPPTSSKTEAEQRHEEQRRKRLDERLKREGVKTHKERVEDFNRYLSSLSEHHDMPRIGPG